MIKNNKLTSSFLALLLIAVAAIAVIYLKLLPTPEEKITEQTGIEGIQKIVSPKGLTVMYLYAAELPMVDIRLMLDAGSIHDGKDLGLAYLTNSMLDQGTEQHDVEQLAENFARVGAQLQLGVERDYAYVGLRSLMAAENFAPAFSLYKELLQKASFPQKTLQIMQQQQLALIDLDKQKPGNIAAALFNQLLYSDHPYANPIKGNEDTVKRISIEQLKQFYEHHYTLNNAVFAVVGRISKEEAIEKADELAEILGNRKAATFTLQQPKLLANAAQGIQYQSKQTHVYLGAMGIKRGDKDYFPLYVGNHILGGDSLSQLFKTVREEKGLAYSIYSYFIPRKEYGPFVINFQTKNDSVDEALTSAKNLLTNFVNNGPTGQELIDTKKHITGNFALRVDSNSEMVDYLSMIGFYDLPVDYLSSFKENIEAVTMESVKAAFKRRLDLQKMVTVTVGHSGSAE